ncbi:MAG TPA: CsgG/HfaB family protein [Vicinamibacterales bacterium]|nr:CsgG/HfaB family protein [Vicinamibacterales bacterium]
MKKRIFVGLLVCAVLAMSPGTAAGQDAPGTQTMAPSRPAARPTIAVGAFETDRTGWMPPPHFGETVADLLASRLVELGAYRVFDRGMLPESTAGRRPSLDAIRELAQQAGVDYVVLGAVTRFANEKKNSRGGLLGIPFIGGGGKSSQESTVGLTLRIVNVRTGELVSTATSLGAASKSNRTIGAGAVVHGLPVGGLFTSGSTGSLDRLVGEALLDAVEQAAAALTKAAARIGLP